MSHAGSMLLGQERNSLLILEEERDCGGEAVRLTLPRPEVWQDAQEHSGPWGPALQINVGKSIMISTL